MDLIHQKYEQLTKCKPHINPAQTICVHPFCLGKFVCEECLPNHPNDHKKHLVSIQDFFSCSIKSEFDNKVQKVQNVESRTKKDVGQLFSVIDDLFNSFETKFSLKLKEIKERTKQEISKPLQEIHLDIQYWVHLQEKLHKSYFNFIRTGLLDEMLFYKYTSAYEKALFTILNTDNQNQQTPAQNEVKPKKGLTADFHSFEYLFKKVHELIDDFSKNTHIKPSFTSIPKVPYRRYDSTKLKSKPYGNSFELSKDESINTFRNLKKESQETSFANISIDFPSNRTKHRKSQNYPFFREGMNFNDILKGQKGIKKVHKIENLYKYSYSLTNLKQFDSGHKGIVSVSLHIPDLNFVVTGGQEGKIKLWDLSTLKLSRTFDAHHRKILALKYISKRNILVSACQDTIIKVFHLDTEHFKVWSLLGHSGPVTALEYAFNLDILISGESKGKTIKLWNLNGMCVDFEFVQKDVGICSLFYVEGLSTLIAGLEKGIVRLYNMEKTSLKETVDVSFGDHNKSKDIININFEDDKNLLYCGNLDGTLSIWSLASYPTTLVKSFPNTLKWTRSLFLPKKNIAILTCKDKNVKIIDLHSGEIIHMYDFLEKQGSTITFIEKNQILISDLESGTIKIWTLTKHKTVISGHHYNLSARRLSMPKVSDN